MGYFLDYTLSGGTVTARPGPIHPGETFAGFFREGFASKEDAKMRASAPDAPDTHGMTESLSCDLLTPAL